MSYHHTDTLGTAVAKARGAWRLVGENLTDLEQELDAERESHQAEVKRLVERAETAEDSAANTRQLAKERLALLTDAQRQLDEAQRRIGQLEDQVVGYQQSLAERNADLATAHGRAEKLAKGSVAVQGGLTRRADKAEERATEAEHAATRYANTITAILRTLDQREATAKAAYLEAHERIQRQAWLSEAGREADFQLARQRASARWTEAQEAVSQARDVTNR